MYNIFILVRFIWYKIIQIFSQVFSLLIFRINRVNFDHGIRSKGIPYLSIQGSFNVGKNFRINNVMRGNPIGRQSKCIFIVRKNAQLLVGNNVGMSGTTIVCHKKITIGNFVKIGGNVCIYDTDFHSLNSNNRRNAKSDTVNTISSEVKISNNVFIGAHSTILKGIVIGENSIIGACSVVTKNIPSNEIWGGNPVKFIRKIENE